MLDPFFLISLLLNDVFVSGLPALAGLPVLSQWSRSLHCVHASVCQSVRLVLLVGAFCLPNLFNNMPSLSFLQFVFENFVSIL